jgi:hypothetical protein
MRSGLDWLYVLMQQPPEQIGVVLRTEFKCLSAYMPFPYEMSGVKI